MSSRYNGTTKWLDTYYKQIERQLRSPTSLELDGNVIISLSSDHHIGHVDCDEHLIRKYFSEAIGAGVRTHFLAGDVVESAYNLRVSEELGEAIVGEQVEKFKKCLPEVENNRYYLLLGNHDIHAAGILLGKESGKIGWKDAEGVFREVLEDRKDIEVIGVGFARVGLNGEYIIDLLHPQGNNGGCIEKYADYYISKSIRKGYKAPNLSDFGHYHQKKLVRGNYCPVMQNGSALKNRNGNGNGFGWIVELRGEPNGKSTMVVYEPI